MFRTSASSRPPRRSPRSRDASRRPAGPGGPLGRRDPRHVRRRRGKTTLGGRGFGIGALSAPAASCVRAGSRTVRHSPRRCEPGRPRGGPRHGRPAGRRRRHVVGRAPPVGRRDEPHRAGPPPRRRRPAPAGLLSAGRFDRGHGHGHLGQPRTAGRSSAWKRSPPTDTARSWKWSARSPVPTSTTQTGRGTLAHGGPRTPGRCPRVAGSGPVHHRVLPSAGGPRRRGRGGRPAPAGPRRDRRTAGLSGSGRRPRRFRRGVRGDRPRPSR
jgi:hypothetical protein